MDKSEQQKYANDIMLKVLKKHGKKNSEYIEEMFLKAEELIDIYLYTAEILMAEVASLLKDQKTNNYTDSLCELARINLKLNNFETAENLLVLASEIIKENEGECNYYTISLYYLANLYFKTNRLVEAESLYNNILEIKKKISEEDNTFYTIILNELGSLYQAMGKYNEAEICFLRAINTIKSISENFMADSRYAEFLYSLANLYIVSEKFKDVSNLLTEALIVEKGTKGENSKLYIMILHGFGYYFMKIEKFKDAEYYYKKALDISNNNLYTNSLSHASILHSIACLYFLMGKNNDSDLYFNKALELKKKLVGINSRSYAVSLQASANLYLQMGRISQAELGFKDALNILKVCNRENTVEFSSAVHGLASLYTQVGKFCEAELELKKALNLEKVLFGEKSTYFASTLHQLAYYYFQINKFDESEKNYIKVLDIIKEIIGSNTITYAISLYTLGCLYNHMNYIDKAIDCLTNCLNIYKFHSREYTIHYAACIYELGNIYTRAGYLDKAEKYLAIARKVILDASGEKTIMYASVQHSFAYYNRTKGNYTEAENCLNDAITIKKDLFGEDAMGYANSLHELASIYIKTNRFHEAERILLYTLEIKKKTIGEKTTSYAYSCYNLSITFYYLGKFVDAISTSKKAIYIMDSISKNILYKNTKQSSLSFLYNIKMFQNMYLSLHRAITNKDKMFDLTMLLFRKYGDINITNLKDGLFYENASEESIITRNNLKKEINDIEEKLSQLLFIYNNYDSSPELINRINVISKEKKELISILEEKKSKLEEEIWKLEGEVLPSLTKSENHELFNTRLFLKWFDLEDIVVEFIKYIDVLDKSKEKYCVIVYQPKKNQEIKLFHLSDASIIDSLVIQLRKAYIPVQGYSNSSEIFEKWLDSDARKVALEINLNLYSEIILPIEGFISQAKTVTICADGELCRLPFEIFFEGKRVKYLNTISDSIWLSNLKRNNNSISLIAYDANYDIIPLGTDEYVQDFEYDTIYNFDNLLYSAVEGKKIEERFNEHGFKFDSISELNFNKNNIIIATAPKILHISTHGFYKENTRESDFEDQVIFDFQNILANIKDPFERSGFVVSGINAAIKNNSKNLKDYIVTARDILHMNLLGTELVVLSACDCGLGDIKVGDGVYGMQRAFMLSGTKTLIMALWKVDAMATSILFWVFYDYLFKGFRIDDSLYKAKKYLKSVKRDELLNKGWDVEQIIKETPFQDPYFWAGFICIGDGGNIYI